MIEYAHEDPFSRDMIERLFNKQRGHMTMKCFNICGVEQVARDCVQEAFLMLLLHPPFTDYGDMATYGYVIAKNASIRHLRKRKISSKHQDAIIDLLSKDESSEPGIFNYHPLDNKLSAGLKQLREDTRVAAIGFMYSIPYEKLGKMYGHTGMTMHNRLKEALKQLKTYLLGSDETIGARKIVLSRRDPKTDSIYKLKKAGWPTHEVAEHLGLSSANVATRYWQRLKTMKKYPESFKDLL